ncbi:hypothetical protein BGX34_010285 [Mortierella sp. NVP85]|nr:hypothetical protein BGX34_010285 [Mortierella sp. NVP85]
MALHAVSIGAGLEKHIKKCGPKVKAEIETTKALYLEAKTTLPRNKPYWNQGPLCKTPEDAVESVLGAIFLDSSLKLLVAEEVLLKSVAHLNSVRDDEKIEPENDCKD